MSESLHDDSFPVAFRSPSLAPWSYLRRHTAARIALGRSGGSLPTRELLAFNLDHALVRDAVHAPFDAEATAARIRALPDAPDVMILSSAAPDRLTYLQRPALGRQLAEFSIAQLSKFNRPSFPRDLAIIVSDGLSARTAMHPRYWPNFSRACGRSALCWPRSAWCIAPGSD